MSKKIHVALVGLGFGTEFIPIYLHHPNVRSLTLWDSNRNLLEVTGRKFNVTKLASTFTEILNDQDIDAVHLVTPVKYHAQQSLEVLRAEKHCACTIPMGLTLEELENVIAAKKSSRRNYMMMETAVFSREFLYVKELHSRGDFGKITFIRGAHLQDMEGWPDYWKGFPPIAHITHALAPGLALLNTRAVKTYCLGSGQLRSDLQGEYSNSFPMECALFRLENTEVVMEVSRSMFQTARDFVEGFSVYGDKQSFEWQQLRNEKPVLFTLQPLGEKRGRKVTFERIVPPDRPEILPPEIAQFTQRIPYLGDETFLVGGGHGGSHPHLVHEFVRSIVEGREPWPNEIVAADWTAAGICAHMSALQGGECVNVAKFG